MGPYIYDVHLKCRWQVLKLVRVCGFYCFLAIALLLIFTEEWVDLKIGHKCMTPNPADAGAFKTSSGRLKKVTTSYDHTRRC